MSCETSQLFATMYVDHKLLQALEEKEKGNAAYKKKDFTTALECYDRAIEIDPTNITFLTNKAGMHWNAEKMIICSHKGYTVEPRTPL